MVERAHQRYLLQVGYVDRLIGRVLRRPAAGLYDRALVVLTADHGVSFRSGSRRAARATRRGHARVPLLIKAPGQRRGGTMPPRASSTCCPRWPTSSTWTCAGRDGRAARRGGPASEVTSRTRRATVACRSWTTSSRATGRSRLRPARRRDRAPGSTGWARPRARSAAGGDAAQGPPRARGPLAAGRLRGRRPAAAVVPPSSRTATATPRPELAVALDGTSRGGPPATTSMAGSAST